jgi:hypothetical protein
VKFRGWIALFAFANVPTAIVGTAGLASADRPEGPFPSAEVRGRIEDEAGKPVRGVDVVVTRRDGSARRAAVSDEAGRFSLATGDAGPLTVLVVSGRGARVARIEIDVVPGATTWLRVRDEAAARTISVTSAPSASFPTRTIGSDSSADSRSAPGVEAAAEMSGRLPALSRQRDVGGALAALPEVGPSTAPAGNATLAGLPLAEVPMTFEGFSLSDPVDGDVPAELALDVVGAMVVDVGPVPSITLRAPRAMRNHTAGSGALAVTAGARGADDLSRPRGATGGWELALRGDRVGRRGRLTMAAAFHQQVWEADPASVRAPRGRKQGTVPALLWGETAFWGWRFRGGLLGELTTRTYGRGAHVLASGDPVDEDVHRRNWGLVGLNVERAIGRGDTLGFSLGVLQTNRDETLAGFPANETDATGGSAAATVDIRGSLAGEHRLISAVGLDVTSGERSGLFSSRQPSLLLTAASARAFRPFVTVSERYSPSLHLEFEAAVTLALASMSGKSTPEGAGAAVLERSLRSGILVVPRARVSVRPLVGARALGLHVFAGRTPSKLPLAPLMNATNAARATLALPAQDAVAVAADLTTERLRLGVLAQARRDANVVEDRFAPATGQSELFAASSAERNFRALSVHGETGGSAVQFGTAAVWARLSGNHSGAIDEATGQLRPWSTPAFDGADVEVNRSGRLPYDRPYGVRAYVTGRVGRPGWELSGLFRGQVDAGTPLSATGRSAASGDGQVFLVPRGSVDRTSHHTSFDVALKFTRRFGTQADSNVWVAFEGFGLAWRRPVTVRDARFTDEVLTPAAAAGREPAPGYGRALAYAEPLCLRLRLGFGF